jgi:hypothetical protein
MLVAILGLSALAVDASRPDERADAKSHVIA